MSVLALFDIDGTLLLTDGAGRAALREALDRVFGTPGELDGYHFHGKTDPQIVQELMGAAGREPEEIEAGMEALWPAYLESLERELEVRRRRRTIRVLPGVVDLLAALGARPDVRLGLLTGNIEAGARMKLSAAEITTRFPVGGFGSDASVRTEIARIAVERASSSGLLSDGDEVVVIGDTPQDIACARSVGGRALAVGTGRHTVDELRSAGADLAVQDLSDIGAVLAYVMSGENGRGAGSEAGDDRAMGTR